MGYVEWNKHEEFIRLGIKAEGQIIRYERETQYDTETKRKFDIFIPVVRILTQDGQVFDDRTLARDEAAFPIGSRLKLKYLLKNPPIVEYDDSESYSYLPYLLGVVGLMFFGAGILMFKL